jgi:hypothetical protein
MVNDPDAGGGVEEWRFSATPALKIDAGFSPGERFPFQCKTRIYFAPSDAALKRRSSTAI